MDAVIDAVGGDYEPRSLSVLHRSGTFVNLFAQFELWPLLKGCAGARPRSCICCVTRRAGQGQVGRGRLVHGEAWRGRREGAESPCCCTAAIGPLPPPPLARPTPTMSCTNNRLASPSQQAAWAAAAGATLRHTHGGAFGWEWDGWLPLTLARVTEGGRGGVCATAAAAVRAELAPRRLHMGGWHPHKAPAPASVGGQAPACAPPLSWQPRGSCGPTWLLSCRWSRRGEGGWDGLWDGMGWTGVLCSTRCWQPPSLAASNPEERSCGTTGRQAGR